MGKSSMHSSEDPCSREQSSMFTSRTMPTPRPRVRELRRIGHLARYLRAFMWALVDDPRAILRKTERAIIWGKIRRAIICCVPGLPLHLQQKHRLTGGCISCGVSCNLLFKCPHWSEGTRLCSIYDDRPMTCQVFPITPSDIRDRDLASKGTSCGYAFARTDLARVRSRQSDNTPITLRQATVERQNLPPYRD
jgi:Fe-S-cluster containining protein